MDFSENFVEQMKNWQCQSDSFHTHGQVSKIDNYKNISLPIFEDKKLPDVGLTPQESSILASMDANLLLKPTFKNSLREYIVKKVAKERNIAKSH